MIEGVQIKKLQTVPDQRGFIMEILRDDDECFEKFGQAYVSGTYPGIVKAWHAHEIQTDSFCCLQGNVMVGLFDDREDSPTHGKTMKIVLGELNRVLLQIPPRVWHGWICLGNEMAVVLNLPTEHYNPQAPDELRRPWDDPDIDFEWHVKGG